MPTKDRQKRMQERQRKATTTSYQTSNENLQSQSQPGAHENVPSSPMQGPVSQSRSHTWDATKTSVLPSNDNLHSQGPPTVHQPGAHENVPSSPLQQTVSQSRSRTCDRDTSTVMSTNSMPLALLATSPQAILNGREIDINLIDHLSDLLRHQFHVDEGHGLIHPSHILGCLMNRERLTHIIRSNSVGMQIHFIDQHFVMSQQTDTEIIVFDSLYNSSRIQRLRPQLRLLYERVQVDASYRVRYVVPQEQGVRPDCGCFAVCNALLLLQQINPSTVQLEQVSLRQFLLQTIRMGTFGRIPMSNSYGSQLQRYFFHQKQNQLIRQKRWDVHSDCHQEVGSKPDSDRLKSQNALRIKKCKLNYTEEQKKKIKDSDRQRKAFSTQQMSAQERETIKQKAADGRRKLRTQATPEKKDSMKDTDRKRKMSAKQQMSAQERETIKQNTAASMRNLRTQATPEKMDSMKDKDRKRKMSAKQQMSAQERENIKQKAADGRRKLRTQATPEKKDSMKDTDRKRKMSAKQQMSAQERETIKQNTAASMRNLRTQATPEKMDSMKDTDRKRKMSAKQQMSVQERETIKQNTAAGMRKLRTQATPEKAKHRKTVDRHRKASQRHHLSEVEGNDREFLLNQTKKAYKKAITTGPVYVCVCCIRLMYRTSVILYCQEKYSPDVTFFLPVEDSLSFDGRYYICTTCDRYLKKQKIPPQSQQNSLSLDVQPPELKSLSDLEARLISKRLLFMKVLALPSGKQRAIFGSVVNVPVEVERTCGSLPRTLSEASVISLKLKRKLSYHGHQLCQLVGPSAIMNALQWLKVNNALYSDIIVNTQWEADNARDSAEDWSILTGQDSHIEETTERIINPEEVHHTNSVESTPAEHSTERSQTTDCEDPEPSEDNHNTQWEADNASDSAEESSIQDSNKDKETSGQSMITPEEMDHTESVENLSGEEQSTERNQTRDYKDPEPSEDQQRGIQYSTCLQPEELSSHTSNTYSIAPGEGHQPLCIFTDPQNELFAFPQLFPTGTFGFDTVRQEKLSLRKYFQTRLLSKDSRFAQSTEYLFYSQYLTEKKQISDNVSIFLRKTSSTSDNLSLTAADVTASDHINGLVSKDRAFYLLQNIRGSPPYWRTLLYDLLAMIRQLGIFTWFLTLSAADLKWPESIQIVAAQYGQTLTAEDIAAMPWEEKCAWIRRNPVTVARHFDFRVQQFFKHFILGKPAILGEIDHYVYRVEFQQRGSPHIHCVLWVKGAPTMDSDDDTVRSFVDRFVTCSNDEEIEELVHLQTHTQELARRVERNVVSISLNLHLVKH